MADRGGGRRPRTAGWRVALLGVLLFGGVVWAVANLISHRRVEAKNACVDNLRRLDRAVEKWAIAQGKRTHAPVNLPELLDYLPGRALPVCPSGGGYTIGRVGETPACSHPGHSL